MLLYFYLFIFLTDNSEFLHEKWKETGEIAIISIMSNTTIASLSNNNKTNAVYWEKFDQNLNSSEKKKKKSQIKEQTHIVVKM